MDYGTLKTRLQAILGRAPLTTAFELVTADINDMLRLQCMQSTTTFSEAASATLPTDFLSVHSIYRDTTPRVALEPVTLQALHRGHKSSGTPHEYAITDGTIYFNPAPSGSETVNLRYYARQSDFVNDTDTNDVLTYHPGIYVYGALYHHSELIRDRDSAAKWEGVYGMKRQQAQAGDTKSQYGGAPLRPRVVTAP